MRIGPYRTDLEARRSPSSVVLTTIAFAPCQGLPRVPRRSSWRLRSRFFRSSGLPSDRLVYGAFAIETTHVQDEHDPGDQVGAESPESNYRRYQIGLS